MKTILVPTDFSEAANAATQYAVKIAEQFDSTIILLHVLESVEEGSFNVEGETSSGVSWEERLFNARMIQKAKKQLNQSLEGLKSAGIKAKSALRIGDAYHGIDTIISDQNVDLVIMGTEGASGFQEVLVGSNTEKVVRRSRCPVIAVNARSTATSFKSIIWATSLKNEDLDLPMPLRKLMDMGDVTVHLVRVNTPGFFIPDPVAKEKLVAFARKVGLRRFTINVYNDYTEEDGILHFAATIKADLIALATHGRRGLSHLLRGSIAEDIVNHSRTPVMTYVISKANPEKKKKAALAKVVL